MWKVRAVPGSLPGLSPLGLGPASPCCEPGDSRQGPVGFPAAGPWPGPPRSPVQLRRRIDAGANRRTAHSGPAGVSFHTFSGHRSGSHWTSSVASPTEGRDLCPSGYVAVIAVAKPFNEGFHSARCRALTHPPPEMRTRPVRAGASSPCGGSQQGMGAGFGRMTQPLSLTSRRSQPGPSRPNCPTVGHMLGLATQPRSGHFFSNDLSQTPTWLRGAVCPGGTQGPAATAHRSPLIQSSTASL